MSTDISFNKNGYPTEYSILKIAASIDAKLFNLNFNTNYGSSEYFNAIIWFDMDTQNNIHLLVDALTKVGIEIEGKQDYDPYIPGCYGFLNLKSNPDIYLALYKAKCKEQRLDNRIYPTL